MSVAYIRSAGGVCGQPAAWHVLADRARLGRPGSRLPVRASVAGLGGDIVAAARLQLVFDNISVSSVR